MYHITTQQNNTTQRQAVCYRMRYCQKSQWEGGLHEVPLCVAQCFKQYRLLVNHGKVYISYEQYLSAHSKLQQLWILTSVKSLTQYVLMTGKFSRQNTPRQASGGGSSFWQLYTTERGHLSITKGHATELKQLVVVFSLWRPEFVPRTVHMGFVIDKVAPGQVFLRVLWFSAVIIIPAVLYIHIHIIWRMDSGPVSSHSST
jgi:hypothetical protein